MSRIGWKLLQSLVEGLTNPRVSQRGPADHILAWEFLHRKQTAIGAAIAADRLGTDGGGLLTGDAVKGKT